MLWRRLDAGSLFKCALSNREEKFLTSPSLFAAHQYPFNLSAYF